ncbi:MAG: phage tail tape measure protein [Ruminococcus flavefaciens]|nr:phage tail tape measure protein [Ruminococcus flavefaciens]MCM1232666.1 phage tail tape measure protein [Ruminococcus flavefaciens]
MASKIKGINIKIGADTIGLDKALAGIEAKGKSAKSELKEIDKTIKSAPDSLTAWEQKQKVLTTAISDSSAKVRLLENAQEDIARQFASGKIGGEQYRAFQRELENARSETARLEGELNTANSKVRELGRSAEETADDTDKLGDSMENSGKSAESASDGYSVFKGVLADLISNGLNIAIDKAKEFAGEIIETGKAFEASLSNVQAISGATGSEMELLTEKARQMGATTKYTASESADAFGYMALAGWKTEEMLAGIDGVLNLAAASNMDLAQASDIVTDYLTAFGLTAQDSGKFVDQMSYAMSRSNTTTEMLGEAYKHCASTAASMGYSVEETTAVLMTMANAGVKGGEAGTALNAIMTRLATDTSGCASKLAEFGVKIYDSKGKMQSLTSILESVSVAWEGFTDEQQASIAKVMAGTNHYSALQTIMNGLSDSAKDSGMSFTDYAEALKECDGTAQDMADTMIDNLAGDMTILDSSIDGVKIALAEKLNPIMRDIVQYITEKMPEIQSFSENAFDKVIGIAEWFGKNMPEIKEKLEDVLPLLIGIGESFLTWKVAETVGKSKTAIISFISTIKSLNATMLANPAVLLTTAIAGLTAAIVAYCVQASTELSGLQKISEAVDEQYSKEHKQIESTRDSLKEVNKKFGESAEAVKLEGDRLEYLRKKLDDIVVGNGEVSDSNKKRAEYILGELNQALGTEYELTGNQIEGYKDLQKETENTIAKKKAEAYFDAYLAESAEMAKNKASTKDSYVTAEKQRAEAETAMKNAEKEFNRVAGSTGFTAYQINDLKASSRRKLGITDEQYNAAVAYIKANQDYVDASSRAREALADYNEVMEYFNRLNEAGIALSEERFDDVEKILYNPAKDYETILQNAKDFDEDVKKAYNEAQTDLTYELKLAISATVVNQDEVDDILGHIGETAILGLQKGATPKTVFDTDGLREQIQELIDKGIDISVLAEQLKTSGVKIDEVLGENYRNIMWQQLNKGYDITELLLWAENSGKEISDFFTDEFKRQFEANVGLGIDSTGLFEWAEKNGKKLGDLVGDNFEKSFTQYLYRIDEETGKAVNDLIPHNINSASDALLSRQWDSNGNRRYITRNATGGYISAGNRGIVAEAGPELIEVMNGGVRVTPLTDNARNSSASGGGTVQKIFHNTYNINKPRMSSNADIRKIAQEMAVEQRRIERGRGLD